MTVTQALYCLSGVRIETARSYIKRLLSDLNASGFSLDFRQHYRCIGDITISTSMAAEMFIHMGTGEPYSISPAGAHTLVSLYLSGNLPVRRHTVLEVNKILQSYIADPYTFSQYKRKRIDYEFSLYQSGMKSYSSRNSQDDSFTFAYLNEIFINKQRKGSNTLTINGIQVTKHYEPSGGKSSGYQGSNIRYTWIGKDNKPCEVSLNPHKAGR
ncbi:hypothetical protein ACI2KR_06710 [Pseudomonas luteola]